MRTDRPRIDQGPPIRRPAERSASRLLAVSLIATYLALAPRPATACSCAPTTDSEIYGAVDLVVVGQVTSISRGRPVKTADIAVEEVFKGTAGENLRLTARDAWSDLPLEPGQRWLFWLSRDERSGEIRWPGSCCSSAVHLDAPSLRHDALLARLRATATISDPRALEVSYWLSHESSGPPCALGLMNEAFLQRPPTGPTNAIFRFEVSVESALELRIHPFTPPPERARLIVGARAFALRPASRGTLVAEQPEAILAMLPRDTIATLRLEIDDLDPVEIDTLPLAEMLARFESCRSAVGN